VAQLGNTEQKNMVRDFISAIKNNEKENIADIIKYPLRREYPIPDIKNKKEFITRYSTVFDNIFINSIINSSVEKDWSTAGWRGIMFKNGDLWLDYDGSLLAVNYQSEIEKKEKDRLIQAEKDGLHPSLAKFEKTVLLMNTSKFKIRVDYIGYDNYRYASWPINSGMHEKPSLILYNGECIMQGSGGNHVFRFENGSYQYECSVIIIGTSDSPPADLTVYKDGKEILYQPAEIIRN